MALVGIELETIVSEPDALTTRPPPCAVFKTQMRRLKHSCFLRTNVHFEKSFICYFTAKYHKINHKAVLLSKCLN